MAKSDTFKIFVVEDDDWYREYLEYSLSLNSEYEIRVFSKGLAMLKALNELPGVITLDYNLPDLNGLELLKRIKEQSPDTEVIIISEQDKIDTALELLKSGAYDYIVKSKDIRDKLMNTVLHIREKQDLKNKVSKLEKEVRKKYSFEKRLIGNSTEFRKILGLIEKATQTNITVTLSGETGTGKEEVAKAIHYNSNRSGGPFVAVNMSAIPMELAESELFGHEKGAFTGAAATRIGKFEESIGGTIFLDEIGDLDLSLQSKLLRVLQEKEITRIGSNKLIKIDSRVIVATHKNLSDEVKAGRFREDLFYRLFGLQIKMPALRERENDIALLALFFIDNFSKENNVTPRKLSQPAVQKLMSHSFPGNIRELKSVMELSTVMCTGEEIMPDDIIFSDAVAVSNMMEKEKTLDEYIEEIIKHFLKKYDDNVAEVAERLKVGKSTIYRLLSKEKEK